MKDSSADEYDPSRDNPNTCPIRNQYSELALSLNGLHNLPRGLSKEREDELGSEIQRQIATQSKKPGFDPQTMDITARNELVLANLRLAVYFARPHYQKYDLADIIQYANIGLIKAAQSFNPARGRMTTHAAPHIFTAIKRGMRFDQGLVHVPEGIHETASKIFRAQAQLVQELGQEPSPEEIAHRVGLSVGEVKKIQEYMSFHALPIEDCIAGRFQDRYDSIPSDHLEFWSDKGLSPEQRCIAREELDIITHRIRSFLYQLYALDIKDRNKEVFLAFYSLGPQDCLMYRTLRIVGDRFGITYQRVAQIIQEEIWPCLQHVNYDESWLNDQIQRALLILELIEMEPEQFIEKLYTI